MPPTAMQSCQILGAAGASPPHAGATAAAEWWWSTAAQLTGWNNADASFHY